jgi:hypothetical protein
MMTVVESIEQSVLAQLRDGQPLCEAIMTYDELKAAKRLVRRGLVEREGTAKDSPFRRYYRIHDKLLPDTALPAGWPHNRLHTVPDGEPF